MKFEVYSDGSYWCARVIGVDIFTQGKTMDALMRNIREAVKLHFKEDLDRGEKIELQPLRSLETLFGALPDLDLMKIREDHQNEAPR